MFFRKLKVLLFIPVCFLFTRSFSQNPGSMNAVKIASSYYNSIVKIILFDSVAEKRTPGAGYLGRGSGFIVSEDGYVFTNKHVINYCLSYMKYSYYDPADRKIHDDIGDYSPSVLKDPRYYSINSVLKATLIIQVYTEKNGSSYKLYNAKIVAVDTSNFDGAILKIIAETNGNPITEKFHPVPMGNSDSTNQGEDLCVYGFPAQYDAGLDIMLKDQSTLTFGKHSGFDYVLNPYYGLIKTDASINSGNSGGPVFGQTNEVIGIASATSEKTNMGLIGGINGMYNLASLIPDLFKALKEKGLSQPQKQILSNSAILSVSRPIPSAKTLKKINTCKKTERKFKGGSWYFKSAFPLSQHDEFTILPITTNSVTIPGKNSINVKMGSVRQTEIGHLFPLSRISSKNKLSLDWSWKIAVGTMDWTNSDVFKGNTNGGTTTYKADAPYTRYSNALGLNYSYLLYRQFIIDVAYKFLFFRENCHIGDVVGSSVSNGQISYTSMSALNNLSLSIRYLYFSIGLDYFVGKPFSTDYKFPAISNELVIGGTQKMKALSLTLGLALDNNKKWKKLLNKKYKQSP